MEIVVEIVILGECKRWILAIFLEYYLEKNWVASIIQRFERINLVLDCNHCFTIVKIFNQSKNLI